MYLIFPGILAYVYPTESKLDLLLRQHQHIETLVSKNQCIQSKVIDVLSDPCWHSFQTIPNSDEGKATEKSK